MLFRSLALCIGLPAERVSFAQAPVAGMTAYDVAKLRFVTDAVISPDGKHVAFTLAVPRNPLADGDGLAFSELHVVDLEGHSKAFISGEVSIQKIDWTPSGEISFLTKRGKDKEASIYAISLSGGEARKVVEHETSISAYSWHPDGKRVAFLATAALSKDEKDLRDKGFTQEIYEEDGRLTRVWVADISNGSKPKLVDVKGSASEIQWCPVGDQLALALASTSQVDDNYMNRLVYVVNSLTGAVDSKLDLPAKLGPFAWSPDGKHIAASNAVSTFSVDLCQLSPQTKIHQL